jgi:hypothetical protein
MSRLRSITAQSPAILISIVALVFALGSGAGYAATHHAAASSKNLKMHALTLRNGWKSSQSIYNTGNPSYAVQDGIVYLAGSAHQPTAGNDEIAVLPKSARPKHDLYLSVYTFDGTAGSLLIEPNGAILGYNESSAALAQEYISLASVSFPVGS